MSNEVTHSISKVFLLIVIVIAGVALVLYGIQYLNIDPGPVVESQAEISLGATSKLGWMLTGLFFALVILFSIGRRIFYKISGR